MTDALAPAGGRLAITPDSFRDLLKKPLLALPAAVRGEALTVWVCHRHLAGLESPLPLAAALSVWIDRHGLREDEAVAVLGDLLSPDRMGAFRFASDLMTALAALANDRLKARRKREDAAAERVRRAAAEAGTLAPDEIRTLLLARAFAGPAN